MVKRSGIGRSTGKANLPFVELGRPKPSNKEKDARATVHAQQKNKQRLRGKETEDEQENVGVAIVKELTKDGGAVTRLVPIRNARGQDRIEKLATSVGEDFVEGFLENCDMGVVRSNLSSLFEED